MNRKVGKTFLLTSSAPLLLFVVCLAYLKGLGGWSAWAAAPIMAFPVGLSAIYVLFGMVLVVQSIRKERLSLNLTLATLVAGLPILWLLVRMVL